MLQILYKKVCIPKPDSMSVNYSYSITILIDSYVIGAYVIRAYVIGAYVIGAYVIGAYVIGAHGCIQLTTQQACKLLPSQSPITV